MEKPKTQSLVAHKPRKRRIQRRHFDPPKFQKVHIKFEHAAGLKQELTTDSTDGVDFICGILLKFGQTKIHVTIDGKEYLDCELWQWIKDHGEAFAKAYADRQ